SYQRASAMRTCGRALWRLEVSGPDGDSRIVFTKTGLARIDARGAALADVRWDGHDQSGDLVDPGIYHYTFKAHFLRDDDAADQDSEALASTGEIVVDYALDTVSAE